jgi:hypothetical protein
MKIQVLKSGNNKPSAYSQCPFFVDAPPPDGGPNRAKTSAK